VYNYDSSHNQTIHSDMKADTIEEHMNVTSRELGFDYRTTCGMCTSAQMKNVSIKEAVFGAVTVTAIVTGGIDINGGRAGDPASWYEEDGLIHLLVGTINIILVIDAELPDGVLATALMTATEAKVAAIQELLLPSKYSMGLATGSGTDKVIIIANPNAKECLTDAGKHSKLGELIGTTVKAAVKEALYKQTMVDYERQHCIISRMERFGITNEWMEVYIQNQEHTYYTQMKQFMEHICKDSKIVTYTSLYAHLIDQYMWGLLKEEEVKDSAVQLLNWMIHPYEPCELISVEFKSEEFVVQLVECYKNAILSILKHHVT
jgi:adenosylcobinamide amidohydrolase